ncbi:hypothetical protein HPB50_004716 [Hyalomma asiaticum]|uniref:Uncharacterized protein n=1 Tax=Hyalomma asiaticum TaxID=266040 RepID=A0ACB7SSD6_HYAAI|nr:hypothetical protein HPB50_004716 [Hyalomma asiaticum]
MFVWVYRDNRRKRRLIAFGHRSPFSSGSSHRCEVGDAVHVKPRLSRVSELPQVPRQPRLLFAPPPPRRRLETRRAAAHAASTP